MKRLRFSLRPKLFCKPLCQSKDGILSTGLLFCSRPYSDILSHTSVPSTVGPRSPSQPIDYQLRMLLRVLWRPQALTRWYKYPSVPAPGLFLFFLISRQRQFRWRDQLAGRESRVEAPCESLISNGAQCVSVCVAGPLPPGVIAD